MVRDHAKESNLPIDRPSTVNTYAMRTDSHSLHQYYNPPGPTCFFGQRLSPSLHCLLDAAVTPLVATADVGAAEIEAVTVPSLFAIAAKPLYFFPAPLNDPGILVCVTRTLIFRVKSNKIGRCMEPGEVGSVILK